MHRFQFSIVGLLGVVAFVAVACAALARPSELWASCLFTLTLIGLTGVILAAIFRPGPRRAFWIGVAVGGWLYVLLVFGPGFGESVGHRLITTAGLRWLESKWHPVGQAVYYSPTFTPSTNAPATMIVRGAPAAGSNISITTTTSAMPYPVNIGNPVVWSPIAGTVTALGFQTIGHCAVVWPLALLGGIFAAWLSRGRGPRADAAPVSEVAPFA
jgi:hypothetical protein